jgi:histidinol-phosphate aminotransferase
MSRFSDLVVKHAREMAGYFPAHSATPSDSQLVKLDSNENPFGPSPRALAAVQSALGSANFYPDDNCLELRVRLAAHHAVAVDQVLVTAGSTEMLSLLCQTMLAPGRNAVTSERSFIIYGMAVHATGAKLIQTPMREDSFDLDAILAAINDDTRLVFLANPNNPTGTMLEAAAVDSFLASVPAHVVVVLDEAYYDFALHFATLRGVEYSHSLEYLRQGARVVVLRTFSKAHGLAGLRIGYGLGPAELLTYCSRMQSTFSVSSAAQAAALAALDDQDHIARAVNNNTAQAQILSGGLARLKLHVVPTSANFLYCDVGQDASKFAARLRAQGISVRPLNVWGAPNCIRVTVGTPEQNNRFLTAMRAITGHSPEPSPGPFSNPR